MARSLASRPSALPKQSINTVAGEMREWYAPKQLKSFEVPEVQDQAPAITVLKVKLTYEEAEVQRERLIDFRLICEDGTGDVAIRSQPGTTWKLVTPWVY
jgi:hypothetical protein